MKNLLLMVTLAILLQPTTSRNNKIPTIQVVNSQQVLEVDPSVQHIPLDISQKELRPPPAKIPSTFQIHIGSSVFRDGYRCGKTLFTALKRAVYPERLRIGILEQLADGDPKCIDEYCKMAVAEWSDYPECRYKDYIQVNIRPAAEASGCTTARHQQQQMVGDEEFCLQVDGHSIFTNGWDEVMLNEWKRIDNEMAILTVYPHNLHDFIKENGDNNAPDWIPHLCSTIKGSNGLVRIAGASIKKNSEFPQLEALWGGGLSFSKCHAERNVLVDSHTPWLWDGEEFLRSIDYWTHGYDLYSPSKIGTVLYHNYSKKPENFWKFSVDPSVQKQLMEMTHNRVRLRIGMGFKGLVDAYELDKYKFGSARSFEQYMKFANQSLEGWMNETNSCGQLHWVPYLNATEVEKIVGDGWKMKADLTFTPVQLANGLFQQPLHEVVREMEEEQVDESMQPVVDAHVKNGAKLGEHKPSVRQALQVAHSFKNKASSIPAWGLLIVVFAALFVTLSNDNTSQAIRRRCISRSPHRSYE
ncbi:unnamed protein product [Peronospora belbahrii]|uniref:Glycosyltransferase 2-like domain-containing protein n=1 Tax=Peronospora belbahrii TaxID=622444 RepID=A0AAU9L0S7_9STRA|nr:unnamed protein product [Peronospora belbahrii]